MHRHGQAARADVGGQLHGAGADAQRIEQRTGGIANVFGHDEHVVAIGNKAQQGVGIGGAGFKRGVDKQVVGAKAQ